MEFRILGPVELWEADQRHHIGSAKERCILAIFLLALGRPVTVDTLITRLWDESPPLKARENIHSYVARLRANLHRAIGPGVRLRSGSGSYALEVDREHVDLHRFRRLRDQARAIAESGDDKQAAALLGEAAELWRAEPLAGLTGDWALRMRESLQSEHLGATLERVTAELRLGRHADLVGELLELQAQHPLVEPLVGHLMLALYGCGRQAQALEVYHAHRRRLIEALGDDPGDELQQLHQRILRRDPDLAVRPRPMAPGPPVTRPDTLPRDIPEFTGRQGELDTLIAACTPQEGKAFAAVPVVVIDGMPGVGKSALAVHLAHRLRDHYPDAQLHLTLHAHDPVHDPVDPADALGTLLRALGVRSEGIPQALDERAALWRTHMAGRRALVLLDDAAGQDQIRPLLPGTPVCLVLVTTRRSLVGLDGVHTLSLASLPVDEAMALFTRVANIRPGPGEDAEAIEQIVRLCGRLPLAIKLMADRLRSRPARSATALASKLAHTQHLLGEFRGEELRVVATFELSYRDLSAREQMLFRRLSHHPGPDFTTSAAAALAGSDTDRAEQIIESLLDHHLLEEPIHGRYRLHDLLRSFAWDMMERDESTSERTAAIRRILDYYLHTADRADRALQPFRRYSGIAHTVPAPNAPELATTQHAIAWLEAELANLLRAVTFAADHQEHRHAASLAHVIAHFLEAWGHWQSAIHIHTQAIESWSVLRDPSGRARSCLELSTIYWRMGTYDRALDLAQESLAASRSSGKQTGEADALDHIGRIYIHSARFKEALEHHQRSLRIRRRIKDVQGETGSLGYAGISCFHLARYPEALDHLRAALALTRRIGHRRGEAQVLNNIGDIEQRLGHHDEALRCYRSATEIAGEARGLQADAIIANNIGNSLHHLERYAEALRRHREALAVYRSIGDRRGESDTMNNIGVDYQSTNQHDEALIHHQRALAIARDIGDRWLQTQAFCHMANVQFSSGRVAIAADAFKEARSIAHEIGAAYEEAKALRGLGEVLLETHGHHAARECWVQARRLFERMGVPEAEDLRRWVEG